ncbi:MAG: hypothetical protein COC00_010705 [Rhizobiales bacterium]|nr:hypothetical protein [Hyphomicrobiales bacterium]
MEMNEGQATGEPVINPVVGGIGDVQKGYSALNLVIAKLQRLLGEEKTQLTAGDLSSLPTVAGQKIQLFAQLNKFSQTGHLLNVDDETTAKIKNVKIQLQDNARLLKLRMDAITEITDTISAAMTEADGDSTYSVWPAYD